MLARVCDRCGKLYKMYNDTDNKNKINAITTLNRDSKNNHWSHGPYDLCPECSDEFMKWFKALEKGENYD